jgi:hypothetical protein
MNIVRQSLLSIIGVLVASAAYADSCQTLLCMAGKLQGQSGGGSCTQPIADYFNIHVFGKHDSFNPGATASARHDYLNSCPDSGAGDLPAQINAAYGTVRN